MTRIAAISLISALFAVGCQPSNFNRLADKSVAKWQNAMDDHVFNNERVWREGISLATIPGAKERVIDNSEYNGASYFTLVARPVYLGFSRSKAYRNQGGVGMITLSWLDPWFIFLTSTTSVDGDYYGPIQVGDKTIFVFLTVTGYAKSSEVYGRGSQIIDVRALVRVRKSNKQGYWLAGTKSDRQAVDTIDKTYSPPGHYPYFVVEIQNDTVIIHGNATLSDATKDSPLTWTVTLTDEPKQSRDK